MTPLLVTQVTFRSMLTEGYTYDAMNNLLSKTDRKQQTINYGAACPMRSPRIALYRLTELANTVSGNLGFGYDDLG